MYKMLHLRDDIDWLYMTRNEGRGLASIEFSVDTSIRRLEDNIKRAKKLLRRPETQTTQGSIEQQ